MKINPKELRPMKLEEFRVGFVHYLKVGEGEYDSAVFSAEEIEKDPEHLRNLCSTFYTYFKAGRLFVRATKPGQRMSK